MVNAMIKVDTHITRNIGRLHEAKPYKAPVSSDQLSKPERDAVAYFFARLKMISPQQFDSLMPDEKTEAMIKREFAAYIKGFTREQIDIGMDGFHRQRQLNNAEYRYLDIDKVIGLIRFGGRNPKEAVGAASHKILKPALRLTSDAEEKKRREAGKKALSQLMKGLA